MRSLRGGIILLYRNVDASFFKNIKRAGCRLVLREDKGSFVACFSRTWQGDIEVREGEGIGLLEALFWIRGMGVEERFL